LEGKENINSFLKEVIETTFKELFFSSCRFRIVKEITLIGKELYQSYYYFYNSLNDFGIWPPKEKEKHLFWILEYSRFNKKTPYYFLIKEGYFLFKNKIFPLYMENRLFHNKDRKRILKELFFINYEGKTYFNILKKLKYNPWLLYLHFHPIICFDLSNKDYKKSKGLIRFYNYFNNKKTKNINRKLKNTLIQLHKQHLKVIKALNELVDLALYKRVKIEKNNLYQPLIDEYLKSENAFLY